MSKDNDLSSVSDINGFLASVERRAFIAARMSTHDDEDAFDIVQDAMIKMAQKHADLEKHEWAPYFFRIVYNKINDWHRRQSVRNRWRTFFNTDNGDALNPENTVRQATYREPEEQINDEEQSASLLNTIENLSERQRQALMLRLWEGFSVAETASIMGCSEGSVKTHFSRAISKLKIELTTTYLRS